MRLEYPQPKPVADGEFGVIVGKGYGDPHGDISLDGKWEMALTNVTAEDCDRLIKAAVEIKQQVLAYRAEMAAPHGTKHLYKGRCQLCGKPEDDELHAESEPVITDSERTCDQANPVTGAWCHRGGDHGVHRDTDGEEWRTDAPSSMQQPAPVVRVIETAAGR